MTRHRVEVIGREFAAILAAKTPAERIEIAAAAHRMARTMLWNRIEQLFPDSTPEERQREFLKRLLGHGADRYLAARG